MQDLMQTQRYERKYFITPAMAPRIRDFVRCFLEPDPFSVGRPDFSYPVHSLYLDSSQLTTYWAQVHCEPVRFKLRVRYYYSWPESPVFFEVKRRVGECIYKERAAVRRRAAGSALSGQFPGPEHLLAPREKDIAAIQRFFHLSQRLNARPMMHIAYEREAWLSRKNNHVRVTVDQNIRGVERHELKFVTDMPDPVIPFPNWCVLELKYANRFPEWMGDLVRRFDLVQVGSPKYSMSVYTYGDERLMAARTPSNDYRGSDLFMNYF